jgi:hypothetical protein
MKHKIINRKTEIMCNNLLQKCRSIKIGNSSAKAIMYYLCDISADGLAYPAQQTIAGVMELNIKTIKTSMSYLIDCGFLVKTGNKIGKTNSIIEYQINLEASPKTDYVSKPKNGLPKKKEDSPILPISKPKNGTAKLAQNRATDTNSIYTNNKPKIISEKKYKKIVPSTDDYLDVIIKHNLCKNKLEKKLETFAIYVDNNPTKYTDYKRAFGNWIAKDVHELKNDKAIQDKNISNDNSLRDYKAFRPMCYQMDKDYDKAYDECVKRYRVSHNFVTPKEILIEKFIKEFGNGKSA